MTQTAIKALRDTQQRCFFRLLSLRGHLYIQEGIYGAYA
jgi:hypothetical protein